MEICLDIMIIKISVMNMKYWVAQRKLFDLKIKMSDKNTSRNC